MRISAVVPVRNGGILFRSLADALSRARDRHGIEVIIVDSGSTDQTTEIARDAGFTVHSIPPNEFGHGRTRNLGVRLASGDAVCFLTHDVLPVTPDWPVLLTAPLADPSVAGVYGRQVPRDASTMEMFFVSLNYPAHPLRFDPRPDGHHPRPGRVLFSNAFSAVRRDVALELPFPDNVSYSEDLVWAHRALSAGYSVAYTPEAEALHAHRYTLRGLFRRTFLVGQTLHAWGIGGGASFPESARFLATELVWFIRQGHTPRLPQLLAYEFIRWSGFHAGRIFGSAAERRREREGGGPVVADTFAAEPTERR